MIETYPAFQYDFNNIHGEVVVPRQLAEDMGIWIGDQILLISIEGNHRTMDYDGFGAVVAVTGFEAAHAEGYVRIKTDLRQAK